MILLQLIMGVARLGFITAYLSDPLVSGFTTGAACHVYTSQIKNIFGVETGQYSGPFKLIYVGSIPFSLVSCLKGIALKHLLCISLIMSFLHFYKHLKYSTRGHNLCICQNGEHSPLLIENHRNSASFLHYHRGQTTKTSEQSLP